MAIETIMPRMRKVLDDNIPLQYFAELWPSVLNDAVDTQADFQASKQQSNMDFTTKPGYAQLAKQGEYFEQTSYNKPSLVTEQIPTTSGTFTGVVRNSYIKLILPGGRWIQDITVRGFVWAGFACVATMSIVTEDRGTVVAKADNSDTIPSGTPSQKDMTFTFTNVYLDAGVYWFRTDSLTDDYYSNWSLMYQDSDVYADSEHYYSPGFPLYSNPEGVYGDAYFKLNMQKYVPAGSLRTRRIDLGDTPPGNGKIQLAASVPVDTTLSVTAEGYAAEGDTTPAVTLGNVQDGQALPAYRFWEFPADYTSNAALDKTPVVDKVGAMYPREELLLCEKDMARQYVAADIRDNFHPLLKGAGYTTSEISPLKRVSSGSSFTATLADTKDETIHRIISDSPLFNFPGFLYLGADVPDFCRGDLLRVAIGTVRTVTLKPKYRRPELSMQLTIKNATLELQRKIPQIPKTGAVTLAETSINFDKTHCLDAALDAVRAEAAMPAGLVNIDAFIQGRDAVGSLYVVRRSNSPVRYNPKTGTPAPSNTGTGTTTNVSVTDTTKIGTYVIVCTVAAAGGGTFSVTDPNGTAMGNATVGTDYNTTEILFLINAGATDYVVGDRFTITVTSPDTRIKSPVELYKVLEPLGIIADGYFTEDTDSRLSFVRHDVNAAPAAYWADEDYVKAGLDAISIEDVASTAMGYDTLLYNAALMAAEWDGSGGDWTAFNALQSRLDAESYNEFGPGLDTYLSVMEQNLKEVSKYLGPEAGYNGETIAATRVQGLVARFSYPPVIMTGVVVPNSQFEHIQGTVVEITSKEFVRFKRNKIALSETLKFIVLSKKLNNKRDRTVFKLMELK